MYDDRKHFKCGGTGIFGDGRMSVAGGRSCKKTLFFVVVHEYQHYKQWLKNKKYFDDSSRDNILFLEYDAEKKTARFIKKYGKVKFREREYIREANMYMEMLKWHYHYREKRWINVPARVKSVRVPRRWATKKELLAPISETNIRKLDRYWERYCNVGV